MSAGKGWSRALLVVGAGASLAGNVRHSFIPPKPEGATAERWREYAAAYSDYSPAIESVVWAALVVLAAWLSIEAIVRIRWDSHRVWGWIIKGLLSVSVFAVALWASYGHMSSLLEYAGEDKFMIMFGPLLPDGMMLLGTAGLLLAGVRDRDTPKGPSLAERVRVLRSAALDTVAAAKGQVDKAGEVLDTMIEGNASMSGATSVLDTDKYRPRGHVQGIKDKDTPTTVLTSTNDVLVPPAWRDTDKTLDMDMDQLPVDMDIPAVDKAPARAVSWDKDKAVSMLGTGTDSELADMFGVSYKTIQRTRKERAEYLIKDTIMTDEEIASELSMSTRVVARIRRSVRAELGLS